MSRHTFWEGGRGSLGKGHGHGHIPEKVWGPSLDPLNLELLLQGMWIPFSRVLGTGFQLNELLGTDVGTAHLDCAQRRCFYGLRSWSTAAFLCERHPARQRTHRQRGAERAHRWVRPYRPAVKSDPTETGRGPGQTWGGEDDRKNRHCEDNLTYVQVDDVFMKRDVFCVERSLRHLRRFGPLQTQRIDQQSS